MPITDQAIRRTLTVPAPPDRAFALFTERLATWWPRRYTWAQEALGAISIEPWQGGRCLELSKDGDEAVWGRVLEWEPPRRLVLSWQIGPEREYVPHPAKASEVEVRFEARGPTATRVELEHRGFDRHGEGSLRCRAGLDSPEGWTLILDRFAAAAA